MTTPRARRRRRRNVPGAAGIATKCSPPKEVVSALRRVAAGERGVLQHRLFMP